MAACEAEPTPTPALSVDDVLSSAAEELAALSTAKFQMVDEKESGAKFFEMTLKGVEGEVETPDGFHMVVDLVSPGLGFVEIEMTAVGEQAYMKLSKDAPWLPLPLEEIPFNFGGLGITLAEVLSSVENPAIVGRELVGGAQAIRVEGDIASEGMSNLITDVDSGHAVTLTFWIGEAAHALHQLKMYGKLYDDDAPETSRLVTISDVDAPVDIQLPDVASGS